jgi:hypothetical protein
MGLLVLLIVLVTTMLMVMALLDVVRATDLDTAGRIVLGLAVILVAPVGILAWMVLRLGRSGAFLAAGVVAVVFAFGVVINQVNTHPNPVQIIQGASFSGSSVHSVPIQGGVGQVP